MNQLPFEIVSLIVQHINTRRDLYATTLINKNFYWAANSRLWRTVSVHDDETAHKLDTGLKTASGHRVGQHVRKLSLHFLIQTDNDFLNLMKYTSQLKELRLSVPLLITGTGMQQIFPHVPHLKSLHLVTVPVTQLAMNALGQHCRQLTQLSLVDCQHLGSKTFSALVNCLLLESLVIGSPSAGLRKKKAILDLTTHFHRLTHLTLDATHTAYIDRLLSTAATTTASTCWPRLTVLNLSGYKKKRRGVALIGFLESHLGLKVLKLMDCQLSDSLLGAIAAIHHPGLTQLDLVNTTGISAHGIRRFVRACSRVRYVSLLGCGMTLDMFPEAIGKNCHRHDGLKRMMHHLDQLAIDTIRRREWGPGSGEVIK